MSPRTVYFGTPEMSAEVLMGLLAAGLDLCAVVSQPDRPKGRGRKNAEATPVHQAADAAGISVLQPEKAKDPEFLDKLQNLKAELFLVFAFGQILPQRLLDMPRLGSYNAHPSLLPVYRGPAPLNWAILNGDTRSGMSIQRMRFKLDSGPIAWRKEFDLDERETVPSLTARVIPMAVEGFMAVVDALEHGKLALEEQDETRVSMAPMLKREDGIIDWSGSAVHIDRQVRGLVPWPAAVAWLGGDLVTVYQAEPRERTQAAAPGEVLQVGSQGLLVACGEGALLIQELQRQGKKRMSAQAFLCGCRLCPGDRFDPGPP